MSEGGDLSREELAPCSRSLIDMMKALPSPTLLHARLVWRMLARTMQLPSQLQASQPKNLQDKSSLSSTVGEHTTPPRPLRTCRLRRVPEATNTRPPAPVVDGKHIDSDAVGVN